MHPENENPGAPVSALTGLGFANLAGCNFDNNTPSLAINRLQQRFGYSAHVAALVAELDGLGPQDARS